MGNGIRLDYRLNSVLVVLIWVIVKVVNHKQQAKVDNVTEAFEYHIY